MKLVFLGPPGVGKGTIAAIVSKRLHIPHISTGEIFRQAKAKNNALGKRLAHLPKSSLAPDDLTISVVKKRIAQKDCRNGFILDGFPRTIKQAEALEKMATLDAVVSIELIEKKLIRRLLARRVCPKCKRIYNLLTSMKPRKDSICDDCGVKLVKRSDDTEKTIRERQEVYKKQTKPLIAYYTKKKLIKKVSGAGEPADIVKRIMKVLR